MLEAHPLNDVGQFDIDAEIVGIELELIALEQAAVLVDIHKDGCDGALVGDAPVPIFRGIGLEIDALAHRVSPECIICHEMYYTAHKGLARASGEKRAPIEPQPAKSSLASRRYAFSAAARGVSACRSVRSADAFDPEERAVFDCDDLDPSRPPGSPVRRPASQGLSATRIRP